ncbi:MAG: HAMP domain-containing protein, partial [Oscillospiraceae bacterium]|nr:HAMP domain-containing protein [Oscillospiraceae bacterium]
MHSIRVQLLSFILALLLLLLLLLNTFPLTTSRDIVFEEKRNSISSQGSVLASSLSNLDRMTADGVSEVIRILDLNGFSRIIVTDSAGGVLYDSLGPEGVSCTQPELWQALDNKLVFNSAFVDGAFRSVYTMPVYDGANKLGALYLSEHDYQRAQIIISIQARIRGYSIIIASLALLISGIITSVLLSRIRDMVHSMRVVASGDYSHRLITRGKDELTELGNEFNLLTQRLDENERQRRRFVSDASHELKTPLASIRLLSDSIVQNENMDSETVREFVTDIGNEAERLQRTTEKLLDLSRLDDDVQVVPEPVDLKQVSVDALVML